MKLVKIMAVVTVLATASTGVFAKELVVFSAGAVKAGAKLPDLSSEDGLKRALVGFRGVNHPGMCRHSDG